jgi:hypothetical protein
MNPKTKNLLLTALTAFAASLVWGFVSKDDVYQALKTAFAVFLISLLL